MDISSSIRDGLRAGARVTRDRAVWKDLSATAFAPMAMLKALDMLVAVALASMVSGLLFGGILGVLASLGLSLWIWPPLLRWFIGTVARRSHWPLARATGLKQYPRPGLKVYREWWLPVLACGAGYRLLDSGFGAGLLSLGGLGDSVLPMLALLALQAHLAAPALVRSLLASWFPMADIDASLASNRRRWSLLSGVFALALAIVWVTSTRLAGLQGLALFLTLLGAVADKGGFVLLLAKVALVTVILVVTGVFCTAAAASIAARWMGPDGAAARAVSGTAMPTDPAAARSLTWRHGTAIGLGGVLLVACWLFSIRASLAPWMLGAGFRELVAAQGDWSEPYVRDGVRRQLACDGNVAQLKALHRLGVDASGHANDAALTCVIAKGDLATLDALLALGDDASHAQYVSLDAVKAGALTTPLNVAWSQPSWREVAERLVAHGASLAPRTDGVPDAVQGAVAAHCMDCLVWLKSKGASFAGTHPVTPMTLWLDASAGEVDRVGKLQGLAAMGMSASAVGADGRSPLHAAARLGDPGAVAWLIAQGADGGQRDHDRASALDHAVALLGCCGAAPGGADQEARLQAVLALMPVSRPDGMLGYGPTAQGGGRMLLPKTWVGGTFTQAASSCEPIRRMAHQLGWKVDYDSYPNLLADLPPDQAEMVLQDLPPYDFRHALSPYADTLALAIDRGWWPELVKASAGWASSTLPPRCDSLRRLVVAHNDASPNAAVSLDLAKAWLHAGVHLADCKPEEQAAIDKAVLGLRPERRAAWTAMVLADQDATPPHR